MTDAEREAWGRDVGRLIAKLELALRFATPTRDYDRGTLDALFFAHCISTRAGWWN
jgi:hypothetical protein